MDQGNEVLVKVVGLDLSWFPISTGMVVYSANIARKCTGIDKLIPLPPINPI